MGQEAHVSEEAAQMAKIQGKEGPDVEAGTPVQEILAEDKEAARAAPKVLKEEMKKGHQGLQPNTEPGLSGKRSFSTTARRRMPELQSVSSAGQPPFDASMLHTSSLPGSLTTHDTASLTSAQEPQIQQDSRPGLKFPLPTAPIQNKGDRHEPIVTQLTNLLMRGGKKSLAEKHVSHILNALRTSPVPVYSERRPLLPGAPPASHLPLNPVAYLTLAIDSLAPLIRLRSQRGAAGGGVALQIPVPLRLRQRRRQAMTWIIDAAEKKGNLHGIAQRIADEIRSVVEGRSSAWEKRLQVHKLATTARVNLTAVSKAKKGKSSK